MDTLGGTLCSLREGRDLELSPQWGTQAPSVAFDRNSGDYWVISPAARAVLCCALEGRPIDDPALAIVMDELVRAHILKHS